MGEPTAFAPTTPSADGIRDGQRNRRVRNSDTLLAGSLLAFVAAASIYRAATQGIIYDEATTYLMFIAGPLEHIFTSYTANNHVLFTLAANTATVVLGVTELTLRLPSIVAGMGYLLAAALLASRICSTRAVFFLTLCALTLNPLVFDFLSAARGYGLALCLFMVALLALAREPERRQRWVLASLALGGAVCANLAFVFPVIALGAAASALALKSGGGSPAWRVAMTKLWLPGTSIAAALLALPLRNATLDTFFFGADSLIETARSIVRLSVQHHPTRWSGTPLSTWTETALVSAAVVTAVAAACAAAVRVGRWRLAPMSQAARSRVLLGGTLAFTITLLILAHATAGVLYPKERTGLYFIPLIVLTLAGAAEWARVRAVRWSAFAVLCVLTLTALEQFTTSSYGQWRYDAGSRRIAELIAARAAGYARAARVATTQHLYQPALEFYRVTKYPDRLAPVVDGFDPARMADVDMVVVNADDAVRLPATCRQLYVDAISDAELRECAPEATHSAPAAIATSGSAGAP